MTLLRAAIFISIIEGIDFRRIEPNHIHYEGPMNKSAALHSVLQSFEILSCGVKGFSLNKFLFVEDTTQLEFHHSEKSFPEDA